MSLELSVLPIIATSNPGWFAQVVVPMRVGHGREATVVDVLFDINCEAEVCKMVRLEVRRDPFVGFHFDSVANVTVEEREERRFGVVFRWQKPEAPSSRFGELAFDRETGRVRVVEQAGDRLYKGEVKIPSYPPI